jgi:hypothetical protein
LRDINQDDSADHECPHDINKSLLGRLHACSFELEARDEMGDVWTEDGDRTKNPDQQEHEVHDAVEVGAIVELEGNERSGDAETISTNARNKCAARLSRDALWNQEKKSIAEQEHRRAHRDRSGRDRPSEYLRLTEWHRGS